MKVELVVKGIIYDKQQKKVLLLKRSDREDIGIGTWENAGGNIESNEDPETAIIREINEETGITDITVKRVAYVALLDFKPVLIIVYLCETSSDTVTLSDEHQSYIWADKADCLRLLPDGIISDFNKNNIFDLFA